jgi:hypothetical protein
MEKRKEEQTLWEKQNQKNPTVWEVGRKFDPEINDFYEVNGRPDFKKKKSQ